MKIGIKENGKYIFWGMAAAWLLIWIIPWAELMILNWIKVAVAIFLFILPGTVISMLIMQDEFDIPLHTVSGLALSVFITSLAGLAGKILQFPFAYIKPFFILAGFIALIIAGVLSPKKTFFQPFKISYFSAAVLIVIIFISLTRTLQGRFGGDDLSNLANLTNWQHADPLSFKESMFGLDQLDKIRFWLAMFAINLAFLSEISNVHGLLMLGVYLEPIFMIISILAYYVFYRKIFENDNAGIAATTVHFSFFIMLQGSQQIGNIFYRLSEDKGFAAFILVPILFVAAVNLLKKSSLRNCVFFVLIGWAVAFTHPIILAYALFVIGIGGIFFFWPGREYRNFITLAVCVVLSIAPVAPLRFIESATSPKSFDLESALEANPAIKNSRIAYIEGTPFYGFQPERIQILPDTPKNGVPQTFFSWSYFWIVIAVLPISMLRVDKNPFAALVAGSALLLLLALIPYSGWIIGKFVTARMLWRVPWVLPIGGFVIFGLKETFSFLQKRSQQVVKPSVNLSGAVLITLIGLYIIYYFTANIYLTNWQRITETDGYRSELSEMVKLGIYLENNIETPAVFIANPRIMSRLPGLSSKADIVFFRTEKFTAKYIPEPITVPDINVVLSSGDAYSIEEKVAILKKYNIRYILDGNSALKRFYEKYPEYFRIEKTGEFWLIEFYSGNN